MTEVLRNGGAVKVLGESFDRDLRALYAPPYKLIRSSRGRLELFHLERDPQELDDLAAREPERAARLAERLEVFEAARPPLFDAAPRARADAETREALRALGYVK